MLANAALTDKGRLKSRFCYFHQNPKTLVLRVFLVDVGCQEQSCDEIRAMAVTA